LTEKRTHNKGFSAMLAEEFILIVSFAYQLQSGLNELISTKEYNFNISFSIGFCSGLTNHRISAQQKALTVGRSFIKPSHQGTTFCFSFF
jgi:hypothetical protein